jgi:GntR family transcriptional repressor for pyruvate dehydrogenase complex
MLGILDRKTLIDSIVIDLRDKIVSGEFKEGQKLASQDELAREMGVSRASLREGLNHLRLMGLIETKHGSGSVVRRKTPVAFIDSLSSLLVMDRASAAELLDARLYIESAVAGVAAKNASKEDLKRMKKLLEGMERDLKAGRMESFTSRDVQFHLLVAESTKNRVLVKVVEVVRDILRQFIQKFFDTVPSSARDAIDYHRRIYEAIRDRDVEAAQRQMEAHIISLTKRLNW